MSIKDQTLSILQDKKSLYIIIILLGLSLFVGIFRYIKLDNGYNNYTKQNEIIILKYKMSVQKLDSTLNKKNQLVVKQETIITNNQTAINQISNEAFQLKRKEEKQLRTIALLQTQLSVKVDSIFISFKDTSQNLENKDSSQLVSYINDSTIQVPKEITYTDSTISLSQTITKQGLTINSIDIPDSLIQRIVVKNNGLFKKDTYEFQTRHSSPLFKIKSQQSLIFIPTPKNKLLKYLVGFGVGILTYKYVLK